MSLVSRWLRRVKVGDEEYVEDTLRKDKSRKGFKKIDDDATPLHVKF